MTTDTSTEAVNRLASVLAACDKPVTMGAVATDVAVTLRALAAERDALRAKLDEARNQAPMNVMTSKLFADLNILLAQHAEMGARVQMLEAENAALRDALAAQNNVIDGLKAELDDARGVMTDAYEMAADHRAEPDHGNVRGWIEVHLRETLSKEGRADG
ncbi:hypothetical protein [Ponticoccus litoralis]|uniref:Uncharacterized protein n=1 Tax=Ponticoccus litoralis TaxID=422297 RepID=A0AAW9SRE3_9RHOB